MKLKDSPIVIKIANDLGLKRKHNAEIAIRNYCLRKVRGIISAFGEIADLNQLLAVVSSHLQLNFEEVHDDEDLSEITQKYLKRGELIFGNLQRELDDETDGVLIRLNNAKPWEPKFAAVINCRGNKVYRAYFSKWHEVGHLLTTPPTQMTFQFRRTPAFKKAPEEAIVDRVAGDLAFYENIFYPALECEIAGDDRLTFSAVERLRMTVCDGASRESTLRAAISQVPAPQLLVIAGMCYKKDEERLLNSKQMSLFSDKDLNIEPKLRALEVLSSQEARDNGLRIHKNMLVPERSIIFRAYEDSINSGQTFTECENLSWWEHSRGRLNTANVIVEAKKSGDKVFALICGV